MVISNLTPSLLHYLAFLVIRLPYVVFMMSKVDTSSGFPGLFAHTVPNLLSTESLQKQAKLEKVSDEFTLPRDDG